MPFGIDLPDIRELPGIDSFTESEEEKRRKRRKKRPPVPKTAKKKKEEDDGYGFGDLAKDLLIPGRGLAKVARSGSKKIDVPIVKGGLKDIAAFGEGIVPAAGAVGRAGWHDIKNPDMPSRNDWEDYLKLARWTLADAKGDKRKRPPKTDSELLGVAAAVIRGMGRGFERAVPDPTNAKDREEARRAWRDHPFFSALDVYPVGALMTRPVSIGRQARNLAEANTEMSAGSAIWAGAKESYRPGAARRAGLKGGIEPRAHRVKIGDEEIEVAGRPWSRTPLAREAQRAYDELFGSRQKTQAKRVARAEERLGMEARRRKNLEVQEMSAPIARVVYSRAGRLAGAFGLRSEMTAPQRARARALVAAFQMPRHLDPDDALAAWQIDKQQILSSGKVEVERGGRVRNLDLTQSDKEALTHEIADIQRAREELSRGDIDAEEFTAALESMQQVSSMIEEMGGTIMRDYHRLDEDEMAELLASWSNRASMIPRRMEGRGILGHGLEDSLERTEWIQRWRDQLGDEEAMALTATTDRLARRQYPHDPAGFYADRVGRPSDETAEQFAARAPAGALHQEFPAYGETRLIEGDVANPPATSAFYSQLQNFIAENWPLPGKPVPWKELRGAIQRNVSPEEWKNSNLEAFFDDHVNRKGSDPVRQEEIQEYLANPLNAYNLKEHHRVNTPESEAAGYEVEYGDRELLSRDAGPGEYHEFIYEVANPRERYTGTGADHWERPNVTFHMRLQDFQEGSVRKVVKEELQSDHASDVRKGATDEAYKEYQRVMEEREELYRSLSDDDRDRLANLEAEDDNLRDEMIDLADPLDEWERLNPDAPMADMPPEIRQLALRFDDIEERLEIIDDEMHAILPKAPAEIRPVPPNPFGQNRYIRTAARRLMRYAVDNGVDEVIITDPTVQFLRNGPYRPELTMDMLGKSTNAEVRAILDEIVTPNWVRLYGEKYRQIFDEEFGAAGEVRDNAYSGRYTGQMYGMSESIEGPMRGIVYKVTDAVREQASKPQALYQRSPDPKSLPKGATELLEGGRTRIHLFERGDVSTWIHELGHVAVHDLPVPDQTVLRTYYAGGRGFADWKRDEHENFARDLEEFVRRGRAPTKDLQAVFQKLADWIKEVWAIEKRRRRDLDPEVEKVFDRMFGQSVDDLRHETWGYFPHRDISEIASQEYRGGVRPPAAGQTIGKPRLTGETLQRKGNELLLYQTGRLSPDPIQLMDVFLRRTRFLETLRARDELWAMGRPLSEKPPRGAWFIRNPDATPERIKAQAQAAVRGQRTTQDLAELEGKLSGDSENIRQTMLARPNEHPAWLDETEDVRWVPAEYVETRFGEVFEQRPRGSMWSALGLLNSMQRMTGIYGRPGAYVLGNIPFNVTALMATMPVSTLRNAGTMIRIGLKDPELYRAIASETGETRASGGLPDFYVQAQNRTQAAEQRTVQFQRASADVLSKAADTPFRVTAFLNNARKRGYNTDEKLRDLIEEGGQELSDIRQLTREQLLDFDALNPSQRRLASQFLYLWPFIYASVKWPAMFTREYPARAGALAELSEQNDPKQPQDIANLWAKYGVDLGTLNPAGALGEIAEQMQLLAQDPSKMDLTVLQERVSPTIGLLAESMGGGKKNALVNFARQTIPGASEAWSADPAFRGGKQYADRTRASYLLQRHTRFWPRGINPEVIKERIDKFHKDRVTTDTHELERDADWKKVEKYYKLVGGDGEAITKSYKAWWDYQEAVAEKKDSTGQRKLTTFQSIEVMDEILRENFPEIEGELWDMEPMRDRDYQKRNAEAMDEYAEAMKKYLNAGRDQLFNDYRSYASP